MQPKYETSLTHRNNMVPNRTATKVDMEIRVRVFHADQAELCNLGFQTKMVRQ